MIYIISISLIYLLLEILLRKILKIKYKGFIGKYKHVNQKYKTIEKYTFILFASIIIINIFLQKVEDPFIFAWVFFMIMWFIRGFEEWKYDRDAKEYIIS